MKPLKPFMIFLNEIRFGNAVSYKYTHPEHSGEYYLEYFFKTEQHDYSVMLSPNPYLSSKDFLDIEFSIRRGNYFALTNDGNIMRVMATIKDIILEVLKDNSHIKILKFAGKREEFGDNKELSKRSRFYMNYISQYLPNSKVEHVDKNTHFENVKIYL